MRGINISFVMLLAFVMIGCASASKVELLEKEMMRLESGHEFNSDRIDKVESKVLDVDERVASSNAQMTTLIAEAKKAAEEKAAATEEAEVREAPASSEPAKVAVAARTRTARIKVLSGTISMAPARSAAKTISGMGYSVALVGKNSKPLKSNTVYYTPDFRTDAEKIAKAIDGMTKPLSWKSEFDIIAISVK